MHYFLSTGHSDYSTMLLFKSTFAWTFNSSTFVKFHPIKLAVFFHPHELDLEFNPGTGIIGLNEPHTIEVVGVSRFRISWKVYKFNKNFPSYINFPMPLILDCDFLQQLQEFRKEQRAAVVRLPGDVMSIVSLTPMYSVLLHKSAAVGRIQLFLDM